MRTQLRLQDVARRYEPATDAAATIAALAVVPIVFVGFQSSEPSWLVGMPITDWTIWSVFALDAVVKILAFGRSWIRRPAAWLDLGIVLLTLPALPDLLSALRIARLAYVGRVTRLIRIVRFARLLLLAQRVAVGLRRALSPSAFPVLFITAVLLVLIAAAALRTAETTPEGSLGLGEAMWWAVVTVTTVGYGDIVPRTPVGQTIAAIVMLIGIAFTSVLTAQIAAWLSRQEIEDADDELRVSITRMEDSLRREVQSLGAEVAALRKHLDRLMERQPRPSAHE